LQDLEDVKWKNEQEKLVKKSCPNNIFICDMRCSPENVHLHQCLGFFSNLSKRLGLVNFDSVQHNLVLFEEKFAL